MDNGTISNFYGKALEDIDVNLCVSEVDEINNDLTDLANQNDIETELNVDVPNSIDDQLPGTSSNSTERKKM